MVAIDVQKRQLSIGASRDEAGFGGNEVDDDLAVAHAGWPRGRCLKRCQFKLPDFGTTINLCPVVLDLRQVTLGTDHPLAGVGIVAGVLNGDVEQDGVGTRVLVGDAHRLAQGAVSPVQGQTFAVVVVCRSVHHPRLRGLTSGRGSWGRCNRGGVGWLHGAGGCRRWSRRRCWGSRRRAGGQGLIPEGDAAVGVRRNVQIGHHIEVRDVARWLDLRVSRVGAGWVYLDDVVVREGIARLPNQGKLTGAVGDRLGQEGRAVLRRLVFIAPELHRDVTDGRTGVGRVALIDVAGESVELFTGTDERFQFGHVVCRVGIWDVAPHLGHIVNWVADALIHLGYHHQLVVAYWQGAQFTAHHITRWPALL